MDGLWKLGRRVNKLVLSWKFLGDLHEEGLGVNEVEAQAWVRTVNREVKKGRQVKDRKRGWYRNGLRRDQEMIKVQMKVRVQQAKEDWLHVKKELDSYRKALLREAKDPCSQNKIKREWNKIKKDNEKFYIAERMKHQQRVPEMKAKIRQQSQQILETNAKNCKT